LYRREAAGSIGNLTVHEPLFYLPIPNQRLASRINGLLLRSKLQRWMQRYDISNPIVWVGVPSTSVVRVVAWMKPSFLIYDCLDNFALMHKTRVPMLQAEEYFASHSQLVFASAEELYDKMKQMNPRTFLLPNAGDFELFNAALKKSPVVPEDMAHIERPILGYVGEIAQWFDFDLVFDLAVQHPDWNIVLLGRISHHSAQKILSLPNVHFLGLKRHEDLPMYVSRFDVCLLPFQVNAITSAISPVKLFEYLAAAKPVVSTPLKEVFRYGNVIEIADRSDFGNAIKTALETSRDESRIQRRLEVARNNTWDHRVDEILEIVQGLL
jgi:glycosyltransferase involved in cell wall biosynthesis